MKSNMKWIIAAAFAALLAGCDSDNIDHVKFTYIPTNQVPSNAIDSTAQAQIATAAVNVSQSLQQLSAIKMAVHPHAKMPAPLNPHLVGMGQQVSVNWTGPVSPLLKRIAKASGYRLQVLGTAPAIPVVVNVNASNVTLADVLRNITYQVQDRATVMLYPASKILELRYQNSGE